MWVTGKFIWLITNLWLITTHKHQNVNMVSVNKPVLLLPDKICLASQATIKYFIHSRRRKEALTCGNENQQDCVRIQRKKKVKMYILY